MTRRRRYMLALLLTTFGAGYGFVGTIQNRNPHYEPGAPVATLGAAWAWQPSAAWLPSYLLCVVPENGFGISRIRSGYLFRDHHGRRQYAIAGTCLGAAMGLVIAFGSLAVPRAIEIGFTRCYHRRHARAPSIRSQ